MKPDSADHKLIVTVFLGAALLLRFDLLRCLPRLLSAAHAAAWPPSRQTAPVELAIFVIATAAFVVLQRPGPPTEEERGELEHDRLTGIAHIADLMAADDTKADTLFRCAPAPAPTPFSYVPAANSIL